MTTLHPSRRQFALTLASAGCASLVAACARSAPAPAPAAPQPATAPDAAPADTSAGARARAGRDAAAEQLVTVVAGIYGAGFPAAHRNDVRGGIARALQLGEALRRTPVANAVDPYSVCGIGRAGA
jgi:hypothetical protein